MFDLNSDGLVDQQDLSVWLTDIGHTWFGDANLDGEFNSVDLVQVLATDEYEDGILTNSGWSTGDWNADGEFTSRDLIDALADGGYEQGPRAATSAVPEPASVTILFAGLLALAFRR
jgi:hypothetical protein